MWRGGVAAFAAGGDRVRPDARTELDHGDEAVARRAVPALRAGLRRGPERGKRPVKATRERHGDARRRIAERMVDRRRDPLETIDLAPRHLPPAEIALEAIDRRL